ncbi:uncharacterized protein LOC134707668 [Mytilus trossulus]|uniref:uncharacterized protein LOC134707668 n=1 Tax=Mytilus trossulus TaxID=6551 RepID=UPI0030066BCD
MAARKIHLTFIFVCIGLIVFINLNYLTTHYNYKTGTRNKSHILDEFDEKLFSASNGNINQPLDKDTLSLTSNKESNTFDGNLQSNNTGWKCNLFIFFGTRPELIKLVVLIQELRESTNCIAKTVFTGQHVEIISPFLKLFDVEIDITFKHTLQKGQSLNSLVGKIFLQANTLQSNPRDIWIVQGDTTSAMAIAIAAFHKGIRIAHVEAGLRSYDMQSPFPEEFNRKTITSIATYNFAPTEQNRRNLLFEGVDSSRIFVTGNTVIDAVKYIQSRNQTKMPIELKGLSIEMLVLLTIHRRENMSRMTKLYNIIKSVDCPKCLFVVPLHPNPNAARPAIHICNVDKRFLCTSPLSYEELHWVLKKSKFLLTDSGGLQEEATWYNLPTLVLRNNTERVECLMEGLSTLVNEETLSTAMNSLISNTKNKNETNKYPYGDGNASRKIVNTLTAIDLSIHSIIQRPIDFTPPSNHSIADFTPPSNNSLADFTPPSNHSIADFTPPSNHYIADFTPLSNHSIAVVLQVFKRETLDQQLSDAVSQTLQPSTIVVLQNGFHVNVAETIKIFRIQNPKIEIQHIASSKNLRFHGRFHIAYMLEEDYVSVWDDDLEIGKEWLKYCVDLSKTYHNAVIGANGRSFIKVHLKTYMMVQEDRLGFNDFVGHTWTLPRVFLKAYVTMTPFTLYTGEDVQLAYAMQQIGIKCFRPQQSGQKFAKDTSSTKDKNASFRTNQTPRELLFCTLLMQNFRYINCINCNDSHIIDECLSKHYVRAMAVEKATIEKDKTDNIHAWS